MHVAIILDVIEDNSTSQGAKCICKKSCNQFNYGAIIVTSWKKPIHSNHKITLSIQDDTGSQFRNKSNSRYLTIKTQVYSYTITKQ